MGGVEATEASAEASRLPLGGEWAMVEIFGHRRHYGRIQEIERFGAKFLRIDVIGIESDEPFESMDYAGAAIFSLLPVTEELARKRAQDERPRPYKPAALLTDARDDEDLDDEDDGRPY